MAEPAISRFPVPKLDDLPQDLRARILAVQEKSGFVPNVFLVLAHRPDEFRAFFAYHDALMDKPGGLTKAEREMIVVATSVANQCQYCVVAHGAILRMRAKNPRIADQVAVNYRKADITPRQRAMLDFAMKVAHAVPCGRRGRLRRAARPRVLRRGHLGHRRHQRVLRPVQPHGQRHRHAAQRRVLRAGTLAADARPGGPRDLAKMKGFTPWIPHARTQRPGRHRGRPRHGRRPRGARRGAALSARPEEAGHRHVPRRPGRRRLPLARGRQRSRREGLERRGDGAHAPRARRGARAPGTRPALPGAARSRAGALLRDVPARGVLRDEAPAAEEPALPRGHAVRGRGEARARAGRSQPDRPEGHHHDRLLRALARRALRGRGDVEGRQRGRPGAGVRRAHREGASRCGAQGRVPHGRGQYRVGREVDRVLLHALSAGRRAPAGGRELLPAGLLPQARHGTGLRCLRDRQGLPAHCGDRARRHARREVPARVGGQRRRRRVLVLPARSRGQMDAVRGRRRRHPPHRTGGERPPVRCSRSRMLRAAGSSRCRSRIRTWRRPRSWCPRAPTPSRACVPRRRSCT